MICALLGGLFNYAATDRISNLMKGPINKKSISMLAPDFLSLVGLYGVQLMVFFCFSMSVSVMLTSPTLCFTSALIIDLCE